MELGRFGIWTTYRALGDERAGEAAALIESLGFGAVWLGGSPQLPALRPMLAATERLVAATGILNVWRSDPVQVARDYAQLSAEFPDRVLLGIGIGHPEATSDYTRPYTTMRTFLDGLDAASPPVSREQRCLAALGPRMLDLSAERSLGTHPYFVSADHTRWTRARMPVGLLAPELACVLDEDRERARVTARRYAAPYLGLTNYTRNLLKHGFTEQDIAGEGSDRLIDEIIPQGSAQTVAAVAHRHVEAGADHVCLQTVGVSGVPRAQWTALAQAVGLVED